MHTTLYGITELPDALSHIAHRISHMWLTNVESINNVFGMITTVVYSGQLSDHLFRMGSVLSLIAHRTGRKRIVVLVDEILKIRNSEISC